MDGWAGGMSNGWDWLVVSILFDFFFFLSSLFFFLRLGLIDCKGNSGKAPYLPIRPMETGMEPEPRRKGATVPRSGELGEYM